MDRIHHFLNLLLPSLSFFLSIFIFPPLLFFKLFYSLFKSTFKEDVANKVVLITGASSGIGEEVAYEYARKKACLVLVARREERLLAVADKARTLGSPDVIIICADVSIFDDCKRFVDQAISHFGRLDHLVNNAGVCPPSFFEEYKRVADHVSVMNINFWGSVYSTQFAIPHLKKSKGKIIVLASSVGYVPAPGLSIYCATKAAQIKFFETLRLELSPHVGITIVTPGLIESDMTTQEQFVSKITKVNMEKVPAVSTERCAKEIVNSAVRGDDYLTVPAWFGLLFPWFFFLPELFKWIASSNLSSWKKRTSQAPHNDTSFKSD